MMVSERARETFHYWLDSLPKSYFLRDPEENLSAAAQAQDECPTTGSGNLNYMVHPPHTHPHIYTHTDFPTLYHHH